MYRYNSICSFGLLSIDDEFTLKLINGLPFPSKMGYETVPDIVSVEKVFVWS